MFIIPHLLLWLLLKIRLLDGNIPTTLDLLVVVLSSYGLISTSLPRLIAPPVAHSNWTQAITANMLSKPSACTHLFLLPYFRNAGVFICPHRCGERHHNRMSSYCILICWEHESELNGQVFFMAVLLYALFVLWKLVCGNTDWPCGFICLKIVCCLMSF